jgi:hypothetical protein
MTPHTPQHHTLPELDIERVLEIKRMRDQAKTLREMGEWCVELEEAMGGRPPTHPAEDAEPDVWRLVDPDDPILWSLPPRYERPADLTEPTNEVHDVIADEIRVVVNVSQLASGAPEIKVVVETDEQEVAHV